MTTREECALRSEEVLPEFGHVSPGMKYSIRISWTHNKNITPNIIVFIILLEPLYS